jgi:2-polyprenyl-6-methoxyphenol hydroxylase-like FAD-dependent oxidoreductase
MRIALIGAGPTGLLLGSALARRGHRVTAVDRDPGPVADQRWARRGVMQFHHAHAFRPQVGEVLEAELPEAWTGWLGDGAEPITVELPGGTLRGGVRSRRETFERAVRRAALRQPGFDLHRGHVDAVRTTDGRADGIVVDGVHLPADLVIDASGRAGRVTRGLRPPPAVVGDTGIAYVDREYVLLPGAEPGPLLNPLAWQAELDGYQVIVFLHERGIFSVVVVRPTDTRALLALRQEAVFDAVCRSVPGLAAWTDPARSLPRTRVLPGGPLTNRYQGQVRSDGRPAVPGLVLVGDAVCTTTPVFGRGVATAMMQAAELLRSLDDHGRDVDAATGSFGAWCDDRMRPWVEDHVRMDDGVRRRWAGEDVDLSQRLPSDLIMAAAEADPSIGAEIGPYLSMRAGPESLDAVEPRAREVYRSGWRPRRAEGPTRDELAELIERAGAPLPGGTVPPPRTAPERAAASS